jgi:hypothetical protein
MDEYTASNGITYKEGDVIKLNKGSAANGDFLFLQMAGWAVSLDPDENNIPKNYAGLGVSVKKIRRVKLKGVEKVIFTVGGGNITNYQLAIEEAISSCEIVDCIDNTEDTSNNSESSLDKLKKLKELLDLGAITQEEYDEQKEKILKEL